ncbi:beta-ketoacyl-ACP reductase [Corallococcus sp. H22C18031201]|uniref:3-oxoacyl-ACP reductase FabG n=1 Tax=Citreicoccus inhibens TaxID=2849499 RepID=UPI000E76EBA7|nr:3-oxoacyl-ACP reductase FabG [Citreicoccus inhibens]MBU8895223.1 3-oxoacyl-ACP reductase FabG [Citreicoccus inhibens]RJS27356.1 beta-ketoacyl-ACP reductase [Corallococcus sp. H22C18031201]
MPVPSRNALVTGGTKGIGRAVALRLAREGWRVTCVYKGDEAGRDACAQRFAEASLPVSFEKVDVSVPAEVSALFTRLADGEREPDCLVNAAGMSRDAPLAFLSVADFDAVLSANLRSTFLMCQQAVKPMARRRFGRIVNFASPAALLGNEGQAAYAAAKAGVLGLTRTLAREVARMGITVNAVSPGLVKTEMTAHLSPEQVEKLVRRTPLQRMGTPEEVAGMVRMLCADDASYITGQCFSIDGGLS